jgi:hypothetical protein
MPLSQAILHKIPSLLLCLIMVAGGTSLAVFGLLLVRSFVPYHKLKTHNDVAAAIYATLGVLYAVLLGFVVIIVWEGFDKSNLNAVKEANCLRSLYRDAQAFPLMQRQQVRTLAQEYAQTVIKDEWETMKVGKASPQTEEKLQEMWVFYSAYQTAGETERIFLEESVRKLNELGALRAERLIDSRTGIHPWLWFVLIVGGVTVIVFAFLFGSENLAGQIIMTALLAALISLILFTIFSLDYPFTGDISISAQPFELLLIP